MIARLVAISGERSFVLLLCSTAGTFGDVLVPSFVCCNFQISWHVIVRGCPQIADFPVWPSELRKLGFLVYIEKSGIELRGPANCVLFSSLFFSWLRTVQENWRLKLPGNQAAVEVVVLHIS